MIELTGDEASALCLLARLKAASPQAREAFSARVNVESILGKLSGTALKAGRYLAGYKMRCPKDLREWADGLVSKSMAANERRRLEKRVLKAEEDAMARVAELLGETAASTHDANGRRIPPPNAILRG